jgi:hypothetical protein
MASSYNTRPPAGELLVMDGTCHVLRRQRTVAELLAEETVPDF